MNQDLFDQVPVLEVLYRYLEQLSITDVPIESFEQSKVLVHEIPDLTRDIMADNAWEDIARQQKLAYVSESKTSKDAFTARYGPPSGIVT